MSKNSVFSLRMLVSYNNDMEIYFIITRLTLHQISNVSEKQSNLIGPQF